MSTHGHTTPKTDLTQFLEAYPHLQPIVTEWGTQAGRDRISSLILDTRDGARKGFPPEHAKTVFSLLMEHDMKFPQFEPEVRFDWGAGALEGRHERPIRGS